MKNKKKMLEFKKKNGTKVIPRGDYCYGRTKGCNEYGIPNVEVCPYWDINAKKPKQYNGYCWYLQKGDWEFDGEEEVIEVNSGKKWKKKDLPFGFGLLWDQCKDCNINRHDPDAKIITMTLKAKKNGNI